MSDRPAAPLPHVLLLMVVLALPAFFGLCGYPQYGFGAALLGATLVAGHYRLQLVRKYGADAFTVGPWMMLAMCHLIADAGLVAVLRDIHNVPLAAALSVAISMQKFFWTHLVVSGRLLVH
jgi:hypothetical protein